MDTIDFDDDADDDLIADFRRESILDKVSVVSQTKSVKFDRFFPQIIKGGGKVLQSTPTQLQSESQFALSISHKKVHTGLLPLTQLNKKESLPMTSGSFYTNCLHNMSILLRNSVCQNSQRTYRPGWKQWHEFTSLFGTTFDLAIRPPGWVSSQLPYTFVEAAIGAYMTYLQSRELAPVTISTYTYGVIYHLRTETTVDLRPLEGSKLRLSQALPIVFVWQILN